MKEQRFVNAKMHGLAKKVMERELRERELLIANFLIDNPKVPADEIVMEVTPVGDGTMMYRVRRMLEGENIMEVLHADQDS